MAVVIKPQHTGSFLSEPFELSATDAETLSVLPLSTLDGVKALKQAIDDDFNSKAIPSTVRELPSRRSHLLRPQMLAISRLLFPDYSADKATIHYEASRRKACQAVRANQEAEKVRKAALAGGFKAQELQGPWAGQDVDPVPLTGPQALPMPVQIGEEEHFRDCFHFLAADKDPNDFYPGGSSNQDNQAKSFRLQLGKELNWNTPMVEFDRGIVYVDGRLDLCKMVVGPTHITSLTDSLRSNSFVKHFLLGNNVISATGAYAIASFMKERPDQMETWYLAGNHIKAEGFAHIVNAMVNSLSITNVWLKRNPLGVSSVDNLVKLITETKNLRTLDLENTEIGDKGVAQLFTKLKDKTHSLKNIFLNADGVGEKGAKAVAEALEAGWQPESLMLGSNPVGDAGAVHLARAFRSNTSLLRVGLQSNGYTSTGIGAICEALSEHPTIRSVDFSPLMTTTVHGQRYNHMADAALPALKRLISNPRLRLLELGRTAFSPDAVDEIRDAVASSTLCDFQAYHANDSQSCSLHVRHQLERNVSQFYGTDLDTFKNGLGLRFLRNNPDVRLIDSVYRTRDKRNGAESIKQNWDEGDPVWAMVDAEWNEVKPGDLR